MKDVLIPQSRLVDIVEQTVRYHRAQIAHASSSMAQYGGLRHSYGYLNMLDNYARCPEMRESLLPDIQQEMTDHIQKMQDAGRGKPRRTFAIVKWVTGLATLTLAAKGFHALGAGDDAFADYFALGYLGLMAAGGAASFQRMARKQEESMRSVRYTVDKKDVQAVLDAYAPSIRERLANVRQNA